MCILIVELNPELISIDEDRFPDLEKENFIYEHLKHYYSKYSNLPTINIRVDEESVFVTARHIYLALAKELGYDRIRAVIDKNSPKEAVSNFLKYSSVSKLDWNVVNQEEVYDLVEYVWLVFFFDKPLNPQATFWFEEQVVGFYKQIEISKEYEEFDARIKDLSYPYLGRCAEFQVYLPIEDERWYAKSKAVLFDFHTKYVPIVSFQGIKFNAKDCS